MALIEIAQELASRVALAVFQASGITARGESPLLERDLAGLTDRLGRAHSEPSSALSILAPARALYRALKLDPTKTRPSSEALIRRVITGRGLYRINRVVDTCNLCSMDFALPIGLYDTNAVRWPVTLRSGSEGEGYAGLGKDRVNVSGRYALVDREGPFGNPSSDSFRTRITEETTACTFVIFAPGDYPRDILRRHLASSEERMTRYNGGTISAEELLP